MELGIHLAKTRSVPVSDHQISLRVIPIGIENRLNRVMRRASAALSGFALVSDPLSPASRAKSNPRAFSHE